MSDVVSPLASDFVASPEEAWRKSIAKLLGSRSLDELRSQTEDGLAIRPLYVDRPEPLARVDSRRGLWTACQVFSTRSLVTTTQSTLEGLDVAELRVAPDAELDDACLRGFLSLADDVAVPTSIDFGMAEPGVERIRRASSGADIVADVCGSLDLRDAEQRTRLHRCFLQNEDSAISARADGERFHALGATEAFEIALAIAELVQFLRVGEQHGTPVADLLKRAQLQLSVDTDIFLGTAKLRATRRIWSRIASSAGLTGDFSIRAMTARRMMTSLEPLNNLLRTTTACMAGVLGGAEIVSVLPHDWASKSASHSAARLARNVQIILRDESNLAHVTDPASGSFFMEHLSDELAEDAWQKFQQIERHGGLFAFIESGAIKDMLEEMVENRSELIKHRQMGIIGVNEFASLADGTLSQSLLDKDTIRNSALFEELRSSADTYESQGYSAPAVVLVQFGSPAEHGTDSSAAANAYAAGGIGVVEVRVDDDEALAEATGRSTIACLCGPVDGHSVTIASIADRLRQHGYSELHLVGKPFEDAERAGVSHFISPECNLYDLLLGTQERLTGANR